MGRHLQRVQQPRNVGHAGHHANRRHDVVVTHDPTSQDPYMTASTYIRIESLAKLHRIWDRGDAVYEVWPWQGSQDRVARIIAEAWVTVHMAGQGEPDQLVEIKIKILENQNDSGMRLLDCSVLRDISDEYDEGFLKHRRLDPNSVAYFAQNRRRRDVPGN